MCIIVRDGGHKCKLVARGDTQKPSTYKQGLASNTVNRYMLMSCLSVVLHNDYDIIQMDTGADKF